MFVLCAIVVSVTGLIPFIARSLTVVLLLLAALGVYWALKCLTKRDTDTEGKLLGNLLGATNKAGNGARVL